MMRRLLTTPVDYPGFGPTMVRTVSLVFVSITFLRGTRLLTQPDPATVTRQMLENPWSLTLWGLMLTIGAVLFFAACSTGRHFFVWSAHAFLACVWFGLALSVYPSVTAYDGGWGPLLTPLGGVFWHGLLSFLMGPVPRPRGGAHRAH